MHKIYKPFKFYSRNDCYAFIDAAQYLRGDILKIYIRLIWSAIINCIFILLLRFLGLYYGKREGRRAETIIDVVIEFNTQITKLNTF